MSTAPIEGTGMSEPHHGRNIAIIWAIATAIMVPIIIWVVGPHIPPGNLTDDTRAQHSLDVALTALSMPVLMLVWVYLGYAAINFRSDPASEAIVDGPPIRGNSRIQATWLIVSAVLVVGLAAYGTIDLLTENGAGGGQGSNPLAKPSDAKGALQVQVIGQQWLWTFRYPGYGGVETAQLVLPVNREIEFHVTSLDVVHSFWAIELGVKADAVPGADNIAYVKIFRKGSFQVRCDELCGLWHGHMNTTGHIVSGSAFNSWIHSTVTKYAAVTKYLPPYSLTYYPIPTRNAT
ncbi:MAG: cytochrome c oxidase subunit II [Solirubrobacteraceae bacterium]|jgi:cytochrome c oxidase subunit 2